MRTHRDISRSVLEAFAGGRFDALDGDVSSAFVDHDPQNPFAASGRGPQLLRATAIMYRTAFPDLELTITEQHDAGDVVVTFWTVSGTQTGPLPGLPATRRHTTVQGVQIDRFSDDQIVEGWRFWDTLGMLQQLGAVPTPRAHLA
jgi:predicted ester cyclase